MGIWHGETSAMRREARCRQGSQQMRRSGRCAARCTSVDTRLQLSIRASTSSENISSRRAPGSVGGARAGRLRRLCGEMPSSLSRRVFFLRIHRVTDLGTTSGSAPGSVLTTAVSDSCGAEAGAVDVDGDDGDDGVHEPDASGSGKVMALASAPLLMACSRAARVWWIQYRSC